MQPAVTIELGAEGRVVLRVGGEVGEHTLYGQLCDGREECFSVLNDGALPRALRDRPPEWPQLSPIDGMLVPTQRRVNRPDSGAVG